MNKIKYEINKTLINRKLNYFEIKELIEKNIKNKKKMKKYNLLVSINNFL